MFNKKTLLGVCVVATIIFGNQVYAAENGNSTYAPGSAQYFIADFPQQSGNYLQLLSYYSNATQLNDDKGDEVKGSDLDLSIFAQTLRFITVWDLDLFNADVVSSELIGTFVNVDNSVNTPYGRFYDKDNGLADVIFSPLIFQWNLGEKKNIQTVAALSFVLPIGSYSNGSMMNVSNNRFALQPVFGLRYKAESGLDIGISPRFSFNWENDDTKYKTGTEFFADYMLGYKIGHWQPAIVGYYSTQLEDDELNGVKLANSKTEGFGIGPAIQYQFNNGALVSASWQKDIVAKNKSEGDGFYLSAAIKY
ncbi:transporter [Acinetobacter sichuanensis]|uniref:SphA family protein n=1 Tax=Acinetobacter sichuanensis TaxID=2136183 RepID=UPI00280C6D89|nr:transporter [Acinetobacter sichuanensis]MDQ9021873.1 transporter [Acinetobacter sichuanensis]